MLPTNHHRLGGKLEKAAGLLKAGNLVRSGRSEWKTVAGRDSGSTTRG